MIKITVNCTNANEINEIIMTKKNAVRDYERVRRDVMTAIKQFLTQTLEGFTAKELSERFGLPASVIARMARIYSIWSRDRIVERKYVRLADDGSVDLEDIQVVRYRCKEYYVYTR